MTQTAVPRILRALVVLLLFITAGMAASAQTAIYGEFSASKFNIPSNEWGYGSTFGIYSNFYKKVPLVRVGGDLRGSVLRAADNTNLFSYVIGPRVEFHTPIVSLNPYVEGLIGGGHYSFGNNTPPRTRLQYTLVAGLDHTILPHLDWRVIEFAYSGLSTDLTIDSHPRTLSTGIAFRF